MCVYATGMDINFKFTLDNDICFVFNVDDVTHYSIALHIYIVCVHLAPRRTKIKCRLQSSQETRCVYSMYCMYTREISNGEEKKK